ncbi:hypothetical protein DFH09DRAFT_1110918 [Mycena vulgaris]|nr:hypothetical protein DFH09DRAFT_1110918 [Mycena vulgaris]
MHAVVQTFKKISHIPIIQRQKIVTNKMRDRDYMKGVGINQHVHQPGQSAGSSEAERLRGVIETHGAGPLGSDSVMGEVYPVTGIATVDSDFWFDGRRERTEERRKRGTQVFAAQKVPWLAKWTGAWEGMVEKNYELTASADLSDEMEMSVDEQTLSTLDEHDSRDKPESEDVLEVDEELGDILWKGFCWRRMLVAPPTFIFIGVKFDSVGVIGRLSKASPGDNSRFKDILACSGTSGETNGD